MPVWRNARLRRLYGKPEDPIEAPPQGVSGSRTRNLNKIDPDTAKRPAEPDQSQSTTPPPLKRPKKEKTRPESEYELVHNMPVTKDFPDYSLLTNPLSEEQAGIVAYAIHSSRQNWLAAPILETFWTRKPRGKKIADGQVNLREKMTKLFECTVSFGPHTFPVKLFTVRDDNVHLDDEADKKIEEQLAKEKEAAAAKMKDTQKDKEHNLPSSDAATQSESTSQPGAVESSEIRSPSSASSNTPQQAKTQSENTIATIDNRETDPQILKSTGEIPNRNQENIDKKLSPSPTTNREAIEADASSSNADVKSEPNNGNKINLEPVSEDQNTHVPEKYKQSHSFKNEQESLQAEKLRNEALEKKLNQHNGNINNPPQPNQTDDSVKDTNHDGSSDKSNTTDELTIPQTSGNAESMAPPADGSITASFNQTLDPPVGGLVKPSANNLGNKPPISNSVGTPAGTPANISMDTPVAPPNNSLEAPVVTSTIQSADQPANQQTVSQTVSQTVDQPANQPVDQPVNHTPQSSTSTTLTNDSASISEGTPTSESPAVINHQPAVVEQELPRTNPNQLVVYKLQQMAARDPSLSELMKHVASGTAPPDSIAKFQEVINRVRASIFTPPPPQPQAHHKAPVPKVKHTAQPKPPSQRAPAAYHPRANAKAVMLAIEFDESPTERYLLPKRSIIEYIPNKNELLWSFLHVYEPESRNEKKKYTPVTAIFHGVPPRIAQTLERCVRKPEVVAVYMKEILTEAERTEPCNLWFQIEKKDEVLLDLIRKTTAPYMPPPAPPKKPTKPRKPRMSASSQSESSRQKSTQLKRGQPLDATGLIQPVPGQPFIKAPSTLPSIPSQRPQGTENEDMHMKSEVPL